MFLSKESSSHYLLVIVVELHRLVQVEETPPPVRSLLHLQLSLGKEGVCVRLSVPEDRGPGPLSPGGGDGDGEVSLVLILLVLGLHVRLDVPLSQTDGDVSLLVHVPVTISHNTQQVSLDTYATSSTCNTD